MKAAFGLIAVLLAFGWVGQSDYQAAQVEQEYYCEMVAGGRWPDYNGTYKTECQATVSPSVVAVLPVESLAD